MRDLHNNLKVELPLAPIERIGSSDGTGAAVDLQGYDSAEVAFTFGLWVAGTHTPKIQESDDGTTFTDVGTGDQLGTLSAVTSTDTDNTVQKAGYIGGKRYIRPYITVVAGGTAGQGCVSGAVAVKGHPAQLPV